jgi:hypothetical protein
MVTVESYRVAPVCGLRIEPDATDRGRPAPTAAHRRAAGGDVIGERRVEQHDPAFMPAARDASSSIAHHQHWA